jgi:RNA polymerase sigma factor (sigma-70 family)
LLAWLSRIADHKIVDAARFQARQKRDGGERLRFRSKSNPGGPEPADSQTPSRIFLAEERMKSLLATMDALSTEQREVILGAKFEGLTTQEIAAKMSKSREAVALLLHRALKRFRESSQDEDEK